MLLNSHKRNTTRSRNELYRFAYQPWSLLTLWEAVRGGPSRRTAGGRLWFDVSDGIGANSGWVTNGVMMAEDVRAEIVASVLEVVVKEGDQIGEGDTVVLLESMKMEIPVLAEVAGTVSKVSVSVGDVIQAGDLIAVIS